MTTRLPSLHGDFSRALVITVDMASWPDAPATVAQSIATAISSACPDVWQLDSMTIALEHGFNIGIAKAGRSVASTQKLSDWLPRRGPSKRMTVPVPSPEQAVPHRRSAKPHGVVQSALGAAEPMKTAVASYVAAHKVPPGAGAAAEEPALRAIRMPGATVSFGPGGSIDMLFGSEPLAGRTLSWVPVIQDGKVQWICAQGNMPRAYLPPQCTK